VNPAALLGDVYSALTRPFEWGLTHLHSAFSGFGLTKAIGAFGLSVIALTLIIRTFLFPLFAWQLKTQRRIQREQRIIAPRMQELRKKFKGQPQKLQEETMKLYREHGINPLGQFAGCLPILVQLPILGSLYFAIRNVTGSLNGHDVGFLWVADLNQSPRDAAGGELVPGMFTHPGAVLIPVIAALATFVQSKIMMQPPRPNMSDQERQMYTMSKNMVFLAPFMVFFFGLFFAQGLGLYWMTQSMYMCVQEWFIMGWGGLHVPDWFPGAGRVTPLSFAPAPVAARGGKGAPPGRDRGGAARPQRAGGAGPSDGRAARQAAGGQAVQRSSGTSGSGQRRRPQPGRPARQTAGGSRRRGRR